MIIEERIYKIRTDRLRSYLQLVREKGLAIQAPILGGLSVKRRLSQMACRMISGEKR